MIKIGNITSTHGIKGELKLYSDFSQKEKIMQKDFPIYIENTLHHITSVRPHKNYYLIRIDDINDINLVEAYRKKDVYIKLEDLDLKDEILLEALIGYDLISEKETLGKVRNILYNKNGALLEILGEKKFYIPYHEHFIQKILKEEKKIYTQNTGGLIE